MEKKKSKNLKIIVEIISCILGILLIIAGLYFWKSKGSNKELKLIPSQSFEILSSKPVVEGEEHYFRSEIKNITKEPITISKIVITYISEDTPPEDPTKLTKEELAKESYEKKQVLQPSDTLEFDVIYPPLVYEKLDLRFEYYGE